MTINLQPLLFKHAKPLFVFEKENREFFEQLVPSRGESYYHYDFFLTCLRDLLKEQKLGEGQYYLITNEKGAIVGRINLFNIERVPFFKAELGYRIGKDYVRKGFATAGVRLLMEKVQREHGKFVIIAKTTNQNVGSQRILEKGGFVPRSKKVNELETLESKHDFLEYYWSNIAANEIL
ncbi:GNAT family N-acetyltransferase [Halalkalibacter akibai]|uniref:N-acetyltransferase domain-containing protein n=1 Tax=Halalkalibacter akibai (strain ATCC 43226 / DSM 21942 / CIP 109018 / JCM 9157 / 1139) TaxID=1236973 RepID=W4QZZ2_HALA3|nr:GNAT family N-acetyltransferase [Halalkalibacter akibai]GAE36884.1 hypothetical protein JCM9157_4107 [Halalkalibacter akibai JCM 9157]